MKTMILADPARPVSVVHHENRDYKPNRKGVFEIEDGHVAALRSHGLVTEEEAAATAKLASLPDKDAEIAQLKKRVAEL